MSLSLWDGEGNRLGGNVEGKFIIKKKKKSVT
jgi:hypothetical protein